MRARPLLGAAAAVHLQDERARAAVGSAQVERAGDTRGAARQALQALHGAAELAPERGRQLLGAQPGRHPYSTAEALAMPSIHTRHWDPLYEAACEEGTILCLHVGSASRSPSLLTTTDAPASVAMNLSPLDVDALPWWSSSGPTCGSASRRCASR